MTQAVFDQGIGPKLTTFGKFTVHWFEPPHKGTVDLHRVVIVLNDAEGREIVGLHDAVETPPARMNLAWLRRHVERFITTQDQMISRLTTIPHQADSKHTKSVARRLERVRTAYKELH
jgi:hypothetical protein